MTEEIKIVDFEGRGRSEAVVRSPLSVLKGQTVEIADGWIRESVRFGKYVVIKLSDKREYYSFAKEVIEDMGMILPLLNNRTIVRAKVDQVNCRFMLLPPDVQRKVRRKRKENEKE